MICQFLQFIINPRFPQRKEIPSKIPIRNFTYFRDLPLALTDWFHCLKATKYQFILLLLSINNKTAEFVMARLARWICGRRYFRHWQDWQTNRKDDPVCQEPDDRQQADYQQADQRQPPPCAFIATPSVSFHNSPGLNSVILAEGRWSPSVVIEITLPLAE